MNDNYFSPQTRPGSSRVCDVLPRRQQEIAELIAEGFSNKEIAGALKISEHTVKNHIRAAYLRLGITNRVKLAFAVRKS